MVHCSDLPGNDFDRYVSLRKVQNVLQGVAVDDVCVLGQELLVIQRLRGGNLRGTLIRVKEGLGEPLLPS